MNTITINIYIPTLGSDFDFTVPLNMQISDVIFLIMNILNSKFGVNIIDNNLDLIERETNQKLNGNATFSEYELSDNSELLLL